MNIQLVIFNQDLRKIFITLHILFLFVYFLFVSQVALHSAFLCFTSQFAMKGDIEPDLRELDGPKQSSANDNRQGVVEELANGEMALSKGALKTRRWRKRKKAALESVEEELSRTKAKCHRLAKANNELRERLRLLGADPNIGFDDDEDILSCDDQSDTKEGVVSKEEIQMAIALSKSAAEHKPPSIKIAESSTTSLNEPVERNHIIQNVETENCAKKVRQELPKQESVPSSPGQQSVSTSLTPTFADLPKILPNEMSLIQLGLLANPDLLASALPPNRPSVFTGVNPLAAAYSQDSLRSRGFAAENATRESYGPLLGPWGHGEKAPCEPDVPSRINANMQSQAIGALQLIQLIKQQEQIKNYSAILANVRNQDNAARDKMIIDFLTTLLRK